MAMLARDNLSIAVSSEPYCQFCSAIYRAWQDIKSFMDSRLPALLQQPPLISSQAQSAHSTEALTQTARAHQTTPPLLELQNLEHIAAAMALLPVVMALPKDGVLRLMAVRSGSPSSCCVSAEAACISTAATEISSETATEPVTDAASITPAVAEPVTEAACTSPAAAEAAKEAACPSPAVVEAVCISPAATGLFLSELHSTDLYQVVKHCLDQAQQQLAAGQTLSRWPPDSPSMHKTQTAGHTMHNGQAECDKRPAHDASFDGIPSPVDRAAHPAHTAAVCDPATTLAVAPVQAQTFSSVGHDSLVNESLCQSVPEMTANNHHSPCMSQQQMGAADTEACHLPCTEVQASCCTQVGSSIPGSSLGRNPDCGATCLVATLAEQTAAETNAASAGIAETHAASAGDAEPPLAEMICMLLLLVPTTAWQHACDEVRSMLHVDVTGWCMNLAGLGVVDT